MNILLVTYWHYPNIGAIDIYLKKTSEELQQAGHRVDIVGRGATWGQLRYLTESATQVFDLTRLYPQVMAMLRGFTAHNPRVPQWIRDREFEQYVFEIGLFSLCNPGKYDLVHAHDVHSARAVARVAPHVPLVLTTHGLLAYEWLSEARIRGGDSAEWRYTFLREQIGVQAAHVTISPSEWMYQEYVSYFNIPPDKVVTVPYGFDEDVFAHKLAKAPLGVPQLPGYLTITCVARFVPLKGHRFLLQALQKVKGAGCPIRCLLIGDGSEEPALRHMVKSLGLEEMVTFLGRRDDIPSILGITDIFVLPSLQEVTPLAISEAQLAGKPVVASAVGGVPDLVAHGITGILVPPQDPEVLAKAIIDLCRDEKQRRRLGANGQAAVLRDRTWQRHFARLLGVYQRAIACAAAATS